jgi:hypothetical protein
VSVSHARVPSSADSAAPAGERVPGLLEVLAQVPDPRRRRGRRYSLVFAQADHRPSEKRIRTLLQALDAVALDMLTGGWLAALAAAGRLEDTNTNYAGQRTPGYGHIAQHVSVPK